MPINRLTSISLFAVLLLSIIWSLLYFINPVYSQVLNQNPDRLKCEKLARQAEEKYQLPINILLSIARVESGYGKVEGITRSWPWTLNAGGNSAYFETKKDALKDLKAKLKRGIRNVDLGCMQINYKWHNKFFKSVSQMMDPHMNVDYGARFLKRLYQRHGSWDKAIKYYHSRNSKYNKSYLRKVKAVWQKENNNNTVSSPTILAAAANTKVDNLIDSEKEVIPIVELESHKNKPLIKVIKKTKTNNSNAITQPMKVRSTSFDTISVAKKGFDFRSFVNRVSKENSAMPKYIRDNWTIVVSIRNQLKEQK